MSTEATRRLNSIREKGQFPFPHDADPPAAAPVAVTVTNPTVTTVVGPYTIVNLTFASSPYTVLPMSGTTIYNVNCTGGNVIMLFPTAVNNKAQYGIKKTDASANTIALTPNGVETIDGAATQTIRFQYTEVDVYSDNTNLFLK